MTGQSIDHVLTQIGGLGVYQTRLLFILSWILLFNIGYPYLLLTFLIIEPPWRCNTNSSVCNIMGDIKPGDSNYQLRCEIPRNEWEFSGDRNSIITEFQLYCGKSSLAIIAPTLFFVGTLVSDCFCGILSDKIGRKPVMVAFGVLVSIFSMGAASAHSYWLYSLCRFFVGLSYSSTFIPMYTLSTEFVAVEQRHISGTIIWCSWSLTVMMLAGFAYLFKDWRTLTLAGAIPGFCILVFMWFIPESIRFLLLKEKTAEARKTLMAIAKTNKKEYPSVDPLEELVFTKEQRKGSFLDLVRTRKMFHISASLFFISLTATVVYLAVTITAPSLGGNMYLNVFIIGIIEIPANFICMIAIKRLGRRKVIAISVMIASTAVLLVIILTMYDTGNQGFWIGRISTSALAKMAISVAYISVTMFASECYPSVIRGTGFAVSNAGVDIGGIITPFIIKLDHFSPLIPFGFISASALLAGIVCLTLKETGNRPTKEILHDKDWVEPCLENTLEISNERETVL